MPWEAVTIMEHRMGLVTDVTVRGLSVAAAALSRGVSRKTAYKWLSRFGTDGPPGLSDQSRRPHASPTAAPAAVYDRVLSLKRQYPHWGPKKLKAKLEALAPEQVWPAASTMGVWLARAGLTDPRKGRSRASRAPRTLTQGAAPNDVWAMDFKGQFRLSDGAWCYPLTVSDDFSRALLLCAGLAHPRGALVRPLLERLFCELGLPRVIRTDNGPPFAGTGAGGLSALSVWWVKLGIIPERIVPGHPEQNGRHERLHRTLKACAVTAESCGALEQQARFDGFRREYNEERPHEALAMRTPWTLYRPSARGYPSKLSSPEYGAGVLVRRVKPNGDIAVWGGRVFVSEALAGEPVGLVAVGCGVWRVVYGPLEVGYVVQTARQRWRFVKGLAGGEGGLSGGRVRGAAAPRNGAEDESKEDPDQNL